MYTEKEKIALDQFKKQFFYAKAQPYQKQMIKLITSGKTKHLKIIPRRTHASIKHQDFLKKLVEEYMSINVDKLIREGLSMQEVKISHKPTLLIIDDIEAPFRDEQWMPYVPPLRHELGVVAIKATTL